MSSLDPPLVRVLHDLVVLFESAGVRGSVIGGAAVSLIGRPRATRDVDAVLSLEPDAWAAFLAKAGEQGFTPRREDALQFAAKSRVLLLRHDATGVDVDLSIAAIAFEFELIDRTASLEVQGVLVPVARPDDLIVMKALAGRARDLADIEGLLARHPRLDRARVTRLVRQMADILDQPEIYERVRTLLEQ